MTKWPEPTEAFQKKVTESHLGGRFCLGAICFRHSAQDDAYAFTRTGC